MLTSQLHQNVHWDCVWPQIIIGHLNPTSFALLITHKPSCHRAGMSYNIIGVFINSYMFNICIVNTGFTVMLSRTLSFKSLLLLIFVYNFCFQNNSQCIL